MILDIGTHHVRRRDLIKAIAGSAAAWPLGVHAQQTLPLIGFLNPGWPEPSAFLLVAFREGLKQAGYMEGHNVELEYRWAKGRYDLLQSLAAELVRRQVAVIAATGGSISAQAAKAATATIPIVLT